MIDPIFTNQDPLPRLKRLRHPLAPESFFAFNRFRYAGQRRRRLIDCMARDPAPDNGGGVSDKR